MGEQDFSFGCESCPFFVGEFLVSGAATIFSGPGVSLQLSPDGNDLSVSCRAAICSVNFEVGDPGQAVRRDMVNGVSDSFITSKLRSIVISKN